MKKELKIILEGIHQRDFLVLYKYRGSHYFQKSQLHVKVNIKNIFPSFKFHLEKKGISRLLIG